MQADELWKDTAAELKGQMTKARFASLQQARAVSLEGDVLTLSAPGLAVERLEYMGAAIEKAATHAAGQPLRVRFVSTDAAPHELVPAAPGKVDVIKSTSQDHRIAAEGLYDDERDIKRGAVYVQVPEYFVNNWVKRLGPVLAWLVTDLRLAVFRKGLSQQRQPEIEFTLSQLVEKIGISDDMLWRARGEFYCAECETPHPVIEHFVPMIKPLVKWSKERHKNIRVGTTFQVRMKDPLTPPDEADFLEAHGQARPIVRDLRCPIPKGKVEAFLQLWPTPDRPVSRQEVEEIMRRLRG